MPAAGPRSERQEKTYPAFCRDGVPLVGIEAEEIAGYGSHGLAACLDARLAGDDEDKRRLLHLVVTEILARLERDQHDATLAFLRMEHDWRARAVGRIDLVELPMLHPAPVPGRAKGYTWARLDSPA